MITKAIGQRDREKKNASTNTFRVHSFLPRAIQNLCGAHANTDNDNNNNMTTVIHCTIIMSTNNESDTK